MVAVIEGHGFVSYDMINGVYVCNMSGLSRKFGGLNVQTVTMLSHGGSDQDSFRTFYHAETRPNPAMMLEAVEMWVYILQRWLLRAIITKETVPLVELRESSL